MIASLYTVEYANLPENQEQLCLHSCHRNTVRMSIYNHFKISGGNMLHKQKELRT